MKFQKIQEKRQSLMKDWEECKEKKTVSLLFQMVCIFIVILGLAGIFADSNITMTIALTFSVALCFILYGNLEVSYREAKDDMEIIMEEIKD